MLKFILIILIVFGVDAIVTHTVYAGGSYLDGCPGPWAQQGGYIACLDKPYSKQPFGLNAGGVCPHALVLSADGCSGQW